METLATLGYNGKLLATQQQLGGTVETLATLGYNGQLLATQQQLGETVVTPATLGYNGQLLATQQQLGGDGGDSGNTGLQRATAGNSATIGRGWWRLWQHWATTGNCWQLSNNWEGMVETLGNHMQYT